MKLGSAQTALAIVVGLGVAITGTAVWGQGRQITPGPSVQLPVPVLQGGTGNTTFSPSNIVMSSADGGMLIGVATVPVTNGGTGSATQNFVDLTSGQNVAGEKNFTAPTQFTNAGTEVELGIPGRVQGNLTFSNGSNTNTQQFVGTAGANITWELPISDAFGSWQSNGSGVMSISPLTLASNSFANQGSVHTLLHGNATGNPSWGSVGLTSEVSGLLPSANGGLGIDSSSSTGFPSVTSGTWSVSNAATTLTALGGLSNTNQGTTTTVYHGNASGSGSFTSITSGDLGSGIFVGTFVGLGGVTGAPVTTGTNYVGAFASSLFAGKVGKVTCSSAVAGTVTGSLVIKIVDVDATSDLCSCTLGACSTVAGAPLTCSCASAAMVAGHRYAFQLSSSSTCSATNPQAMVCEGELLTP